MQKYGDAHTYGTGAGNVSVGNESMQPFAALTHLNTTQPIRNYGYRTSIWRHFRPDAVRLAHRGIPRGPAHYVH